MYNAYPYSKLHYEHEVLWARFEIREHYLKTVVRNIYENVGQVLSLVRVQLSMLCFESEPEKLSTEGSGELIGQVIRDLRHMCRNFYPETELLEKTGFGQALRSQFLLLGMQEEQLLFRGTQHLLGPGREVIIFRMLQELLVSIQNQDNESSLQLKTFFGRKAVGFIFSYPGEPMEIRSLSETRNQSGLNRLSLAERAQLLGAAFTISKKNNIVRIKLVVPFKLSVYE